MFRNIVIFLVLFCIFVFTPSCEYIQEWIGGTEQESPDQPGLSRYVGQDLRNLKLSEKRELQRAIKKLTGVKVEIYYPRLRPWWVSEYHDGETRWILFEGYEGFNIPDWSVARIRCFNENWKYLGSSDVFTIGYQAFLTEAKVMREPVLETDVIDIRAISAGYSWILEDKKAPVGHWGGKYRRQVYAILDRHVTLVRIETDEQNVILNSYQQGNQLGPDVPKRAVEQWHKSLDSKNPCEVLETLVWLSGEHLPSEEERIPDRAQESVEDSRLFETVRDSPEVKQKLLTLRESPNIWIRQMAEFAIAREQGLIGN